MLLGQVQSDCGTNALYVPVQRGLTENEQRRTEALYPRVNGNPIDVGLGREIPAPPHLVHQADGVTNDGGRFVAKFR